MSLADQQWCPTSVQVTILQARGLRIKGKSGTNDAYAVMQVGKEKYQTSVVEKSVAPVWKEEATFDLPPLLQGGGGGGTERSTLHVHVLHRALMGPDKLLGQAVINLPQLSEDRTRNKTEWFKLLDKSGKPDKDRGEVLVDIQFMRNNMTASMFDLSAAGKSRSRLGKFKDKVRGKKKESDSASSIVPSFSQILTDSEDEANGDGEAASKDGKSKKHKMKSLFSHKSNLQRNMSQSMSVLPAKNSSLSGSQSSGLNVESSEGKKKYKFMIHKRSSSSDSKDSSSGHQKQVPVEQSNLCINGSHIYCEESQPRSSRISSNFSLASSGHGSMEDVPENSPPSVDSLRAVRQFSPWMEEEEEEKDNVDGSKKEKEERTDMEEHGGIEDEETLWNEEELEKLAKEKLRQEEEERRKLEEKDKREEKERIRKDEERTREERLKREEEEQQRLSEDRRRQEEQERQKLEKEEKRHREEEEKIRREEEKRRQEEERAEERRKEEEWKLAEEKRRLKEEEERRIEEEKVRKEEEQQRKEEERVKEERRRKEAEEALVIKREADKMREREEEEKLRREEIKRQEEEEWLRKEKEEYERKTKEIKFMEERERIDAEKKLEEKMRMEEERKREEEEEERSAKRQQLEEKRRLEDQERRVEQEKNQREERIRKEEEMRKEKEEMLKRQQEELERLAKEKLKQEEEERRKVEEEKLKTEEEARIRKEEEMRKKVEEEKLKREEEERIRKEEEMRRKVEEEKLKREEEERISKEEEMRRKVEEEKLKREERIRRQEEMRQEEEERARRQEEIRQEEEERAKRQEEMRQEEEERAKRQEEMRREEEERARKEKEELERLEEEKMRQEKRRKEEKEIIEKEDQEMIRKEQEQERARQERYKTERLAVETKRPQDQEKRIEGEDGVGGEERAGKEREGKEARKQGKENLTTEAEEQTKRESGTNEERGAENKCITSTNPFDEKVSYNPSEEISKSPSVPHSHTTEEETVRQRCQSSVSVVGSMATSTNEKDPITTQREKRLAPLPPGKSQAERPRHKEQDVSTERLSQMNKQTKDVKTVSVLPQRSVQAITPQSQSPLDSKNTQSSVQNSTIKVTTAKQSRRPAPSRPSSVDEPSSESKTTLSSGKISQRGASEMKQVQVVYGLNPFEDDIDDDELIAQDDTTVSGNTGAVHWPAALSQTADKDASTQVKFKSSKIAHAPPPPAKSDTTLGTLINQTNDEGHGTGNTGTTVPNNACDPQAEAKKRLHFQKSPNQVSRQTEVQNIVVAGVGEEGPPPSSRRLQPVKPLNAPEQRSALVVKGEKDHRSTEILSGVQDKTKVNDSGMAGPYSQLTQEELISLVLKQESQLSERDKTISELEQYIDNLLVRVIEEQPSILMSLSSLKKAA